MHIILLKFGDNKSSASNFLKGHNAWIAKGFADGIFQCVGSLDVGGGFILAHREEDDAIERRVQDDPFVEQGVVTAEVHHIEVKRTVPELSYLASTA